MEPRRYFSNKYLNKSDSCDKEIPVIVSELKTLARGDRNLIIEKWNDVVKLIYNPDFNVRKSLLHFIGDLVENKPDFICSGTTRVVNKYLNDENSEVSSLALKTARRLFASLLKWVHSASSITERMQDAMKQCNELKTKCNIILKTSVNNTETKRIETLDGLTKYLALSPAQLDRELKKNNVIRHKLLSDFKTMAKKSEGKSLKKYAFYMQYLRKLEKKDQDAVVRFVFW